MPALNFQKQFAPAVESGEKQQTIRAYRKDGRDVKVGDKLYLYYGMRTKQCRKLGEAHCISVSRLRLLGRHVATGNVNLLYGNPGKRSGIDRFCVASSNDHGNSRRRFNRFAKADGFSSADEMVEWFDKTHGLPFEGLLIKWGKLSCADEGAGG